MELVGDILVVGNNSNSWVIMFDWCHDSRCTDGWIRIVSEWISSLEYLLFWSLNYYSEISINYYVGENSQVESVFENVLNVFYI